MTDFRSGFIAILGKPNVGKSTLVNGLLGQKIAAVSPRAQTTRRRQLGILTLPEAQLVFVDTPGVHTPRHKLGEFFNQEAEEALDGVDVVLFLVDASSEPDEEDQQAAGLVMRLRHKTSLIMGLNKIDKVPEQAVEAARNMYQPLAPEAPILTFSAASHDRLPIFSIDNMQVLNRCTLPDEVIEGHRTDFEIAKAFVKSKLPFCDHYLITTFFHPPIRKDRTSLHPPILRPEILAAKPSEGDHLLVYQTAEGHETLARTLEATGLECRVYGMRRGITEEQVEGNLRYRPFSEGGFIADLASAKGVIAGGGFTLMGEAVFLHKPMLSVPVEGQFEQVLNGRYLQKLGYGRYAEDLDDPKTVHAFVEAIPDCAAALASYANDHNEGLFRELNGLLDQAEAGLFG